MSQPSAVSTIFTVMSCQGRAFPHLQRELMSWKRGLPKCQPQVLSRLARGECKELQPWDPTTSTGWLGPHRAGRWGWEAGLAWLGVSSVPRKHHCRGLVLSFSHDTQSQTVRNVSRDV